MCVGVVGLKDVEEAMDICLGCRCFDFLFVFLVDTQPSVCESCGFLNFSF